MKSDITRDTFSIENHFSRVISQQGRVMLDADTNEQTSILLHYLRTLAFDLIGPYAAPVLAPGFKLSKDNNQDLVISAGRYYIRGLLVENDSTRLYKDQPYHLTEDDPFGTAIKDKVGPRHWVYLDAWERQVTSLEDDRIREKALGGPDTCTRAKVVWQVRGLNLDPSAQQAHVTERRKRLQDRKKKLQDSLIEPKSTVQRTRIDNQIAKIDRQLQRLNPELNTCEAPLNRLLPLSDATMAARIDPGSQIVDACVTSPDSKYRGAENQLYRVEVHRGGIAGEATIKWSRDNASANTAWLGTSGDNLEVANARGFSAGKWVELIDDVAELRGTPGILGRLNKVEGGTLSVDSESVASSDKLAWSEDAIHAKVRRWDHFETEDIVLEGDGSILIQETPVGTPDADATWMDLEDGIQIQFAEGGEYRSGDYWLIPARVETGNIEWPDPVSDPPDLLSAHLPPHGVIHYYAPLGFVRWDANQLIIDAQPNCYCEFEPLSSCFIRGNVAIGVNQLTGAAITPAAEQDEAARPATPPGGAPTPKASKKRPSRPRKRAK